MEMCSQCLFPVQLVSIQSIISTHFYMCMYSGRAEKKNVFNTFVIFNNRYC